MPGEAQHPRTPRHQADRRVPNSIFVATGCSPSPRAGRRAPPRTARTLPCCSTSQKPLDGVVGRAAVVSPTRPRGHRPGAEGGRRVALPARAPARWRSASCATVRDLLPVGVDGEPSSAPSWRSGGTGETAVRRPARRGEYAGSVGAVAPRTAARLPATSKAAPPQNQRPWHDGFDLPAYSKRAGEQRAHGSPSPARHWWTSARRGVRAQVATGFPPRGMLGDHQCGSAPLLLGGDTTTGAASREGGNHAPRMPRTASLTAVAAPGDTPGVRAELAEPVWVRAITSRDRCVGAVVLSRRTTTAQRPDRLETLVRCPRRRVTEVRAFDAVDRDVVVGPVADVLQRLRLISTRAVTSARGAASSRSWSRSPNCSSKPGAPSTPSVKAGRYRRWRPQSS
jgi:hypothetical protein